MSRVCGPSPQQEQPRPLGICGDSDFSSERRDGSRGLGDVGWGTGRGGAGSGCWQGRGTKGVSRGDG